MKSKTSFFNHTLFFNLLKRYWPIFAGYFVIWLIVLPLALGNTLSYTIIHNQISDNNLIVKAAQLVLNTGIYGGVIMSGIFGMIIAMAAFNYLYSGRSVSMMCSLPIKREGVFLSVFSSGLVGLFASNVIIFFITLAVEAAYGALGISYLFQWLAMVCMMNLFFFGFAALCASFTGHILVLPILYIVLNFTAYVVEFIIRTVMSVFIYGASMSDAYKIKSFSPVIKITTETKAVSIFEPLTDGTTKAIGYYYNGWTILGIYAAVGIVFAVCAMLFIKHRRMETAADVVAVRPLKPIFKYCLSLGCALVLGTVIYFLAFSNTYSIHGIESALLLLLFMLFGAFIGYFAAEMLLQKTLHVFAGHNWIGMGITALLISAVVFCGEYNVFGYETKLPEIDEVQDVSIVCSGESALLDQSENIKAAISLHNDIISHKYINEQNAGNFDINNYYVRILYTLKNGKTLEREYEIYYPATDDILTLTDVMNSKEAVEKRKEIEIPVSVDSIADAYLSYFDKANYTYQDIELTSEQAYELYTECILPDIDDLTLGKVWYVNDDEYYKNVYDCTINISLSQRIKVNEYNDSYFHTTFTANAARSNKWIEENLGIEMCTMGESSDILNSQYSEKEGVVYAESAVKY